MNEATSKEGDNMIEITKTRDGSMYLNSIQDLPKISCIHFMHGKWMESRITYYKKQLETIGTK